MRLTLLLAFLLFTTLVRAQSEFEPGYLVTSEGERKAVEIYNYDWSDNPTSFRYRTSADSVFRAEIGEVREFGLDDGRFRYLRATVPIDQSEDQDWELSTSETPEYREQTVFLEWLVDGEADLLYWQDDDLRRFFFRVGPEPIQPLISRRYRQGQLIFEQTTYRGQLRSEVNCDINDRELRVLAYSRKNLTAYFRGYNACRGVDFVVASRQPEGRRVSVNLRAGGSYSGGRMLLSNGIGGHVTKTIEYTPAPRLGLEVEMMLPFLNNRWAVIGEMYYRRLTTNSSMESREKVAIHLRSVNFPVGVRRYLHLGGGKAIFVSAGGMLQFPTRSFITSYNGSGARSFNASWNFGVQAAAGLQFNDRLKVEAQFHHDQDVLQDYIYYSTYLRGISLLASYRVL